jgi:coproporphyrinogen III oxidase-like Fe-S oxidoreductase
VVRQVRFREPKLYMDNALAGQAVAQDDEVARADLPFEYMLNALRLKEGVRAAGLQDRTGLPLSAIQQGLEERSKKA